MRGTLKVAVPRHREVEEPVVTQGCLSVGRFDQSDPSDTWNHVCAGKYWTNPIFPLLPRPSWRMETASGSQGSSWNGHRLAEFKEL